MYANAGRKQLTNAEWNRRFDELHGAEARAYYLPKQCSYMGSSLVTAGNGFPLVRRMRTVDGCSL